MKTIATIAGLEALYGHPGETSTVKEVNYVTAEYRAYIEAAPFAALATCGPEGLDCSPRGDGPGFVRIHDPRTLLLPDRRGNNRIDSLRNIVRDPRVALLFLIPGIGNTLRVNGRAKLSADAALLESFAIEAMAPRSVMVMQIDAIYFQCARALVRSDLWNPARYLPADALPSAGQILAALSGQRLGGAEYDQLWPERAKQSLW